LNRNEELNRVLREAEQFKAQAATLQKEIQLKKQLLDSTALELEDVKAEYAELQIRERTLRAELDSLRRDATALSMQEKEGNTAIRELKAKTESLSAEKRAVVSVLGDLERVTASSDDSLEETRKLLKQAIDERAVLQAEIEEKQLALSTLRSGNGFAEETVSRLRREMEEAEEEIGTVLQQGASSETLVSGYRERIALLEEQLEEERAAHASLEDTLADLNGKREKAQREQRVYFERRESYSEMESTLTREKLRLEAIIERAEEKLDAAVEYIWQEYGLTPEEAARFNDDSLKGETPQEIRKNANRLRSQIKALGHVNVNAIEAYAEISERYEYLKAQHEDLKKAEEALTGIITDLDNGMRKQFREKFAEIRTEYDKVFRELFGGGRGTIEIDEKADIIDADITIISQPPGKKLQNMLQLSGGEKALSAIALIFAIQNLKPSPFALLDEIEAALDDANVGRFTGYLKKLTARTQFIVITHRRGTMVSCDRLYGITMQEKGVSTLVSVSLVEHELDA
ncbi:MAG: AAA family ATPase, partial [Lachnospiraceae bacterium]|nr:AAA family ATPase [Lachnospiraceae bacterium]